MKILKQVALAAVGCTLFTAQTYATPTYRTCKEIKELNPESTSGVYQISPDGGRVFDNYCDMETDGGGWTLVIGPGLKFGKDSDFWKGTSTSHDYFSYKGSTFHSSYSQRIIAGLQFDQLMLNFNEPTIYRSVENNTTFAQKLARKTVWEKKSGPLGNIVWNGSDQFGYTISQYLLGVKGAYNGRNDYAHHFIGGSSRPNGSKYGITFHWTGEESHNCGVEATRDGGGCTDVTEIHDHTIGASGDRNVWDSADYGMFVRESRSYTDYKTCRDILDKNPKFPSGFYNISPDGGESFRTYCDMTTDGGGWTLVIGPGMEISTSSALWSGTLSDTHNQKFSYKGEIFETKDSNRIIANLKFDELLFNFDGPSIYRSESKSTTFAQKLDGIIHWKKVSGELPEIHWYQADTDGYTQGYYLLGGKGSRDQHGDYFHYFIGGINRATSYEYGTYFHWLGKREYQRCPNPDSENGCNTLHWKNHGIGISSHRKVADAPEYAMFFREPSYIKKSCKEIKDTYGNVASGVYKISPDGGTPFEVYCDMETDGGGWTLVIGAGLQFGPKSYFWDGTLKSDQTFHYKNLRFNSRNSEKILANLPFQDMMLQFPDANIYRSSQLSTFAEKKKNKSTWSKKSGRLNNIEWELKDTDGYTVGTYLLGTQDELDEFEDFHHYFIGGSSRSDDYKYGTFFYWTGIGKENCGSDNGCLASDGDRFHAIGKNDHRRAIDASDYGMFFR